MKLTRRDFVRTAALGAAGLASSSPSRSAASAPVSGTGGRRRNVLFIATDDMNVDLGCYGNALARTPNLDRLAREGVLFNRAYCQYPLCSPSRTSLLTGLRPDRTGIYDLAEHFRWSMPDRVTLPQLFKNHGYASIRAGKIYHYGNPREIGTSGLDDPDSWTYTINPAGRDKNVLEPEALNYTPETRAGSPLTNRLGSSIAFLNDREGRDEEYTDGRLATSVIHQLEDNRDRPFFIAAGFFRPHCPYIAPQKYFDLHPLDGISVPEVGEEYRRTVPEAALLSTNPWPRKGLSLLQAREAAQAYAASISFVDAQVGRLLDALDRLQLREKTIVVFWSDHGQHLGDHGLWFKSSLFEKSARVPLIISDPSAGGNGQACPRTVELLDLYPTLAGLCGLNPPAAVQGRSLGPLLDHPEAAWDRPAFTQVWRTEGNYSGHSIRTEDYRYTEWDEGKKGIELYDFRAGPGEERNLAGDSKYARIASDLRARLRANWPVSFRPTRFNADGDAESRPVPVQG